MFFQNKNQILIGLIFLVSYLVLAVIALRPPLSFDAFWHIKMGQDLIENGMSPWADHYSFTHGGSRISTVPVMFQVVSYYFVRDFGLEAGLYGIKLLYLTLFMGALFIYFRYIKTSVLVALFLVPVVSYFIVFRLMVRPEIFSNVFIVFSIMLYLKVRSEFSNKDLVAVAALLLFWVNYHSPILGYIIFAGLFVEKALKKLSAERDAFTWSSWFFWGFALLLLGFVKPLGEHFLITTYAAMRDGFGNFINEYNPSYQMYSKHYIVYAFWAVSVYVAVWSLIRKEYGFLFIVLVATYFSVVTARLITSALIINLCLAAYYLKDFSIAGLARKINVPVRVSLMTAIASMIIYVGYSLGSMMKISYGQYQNYSSQFQKRYPVQIADYLMSFHGGGNIINYLAAGGYLIHTTSPKYKVYYDGRSNILYPIDFVMREALLRNDSDVLVSEIERYGVSHVLIKKEIEALRVVNDVDSLQLNFADGAAVLFATKQEDVAFPIASAWYIFPMCWDDRRLDDVVKEITLSKTLFAEKDYLIKHVLEFIEGLEQSEDKRKFLVDVAKKELDDSVYRLAAYAAFSLNAEDAAFSLLSKVKIKDTIDTLYSAVLIAKKGNYEAAESLAYFYYFTNRYTLGRNVSFHEIKVLRNLLQLLLEQDELTQFEPAYIDNLSRKLSDRGYKEDEDDICRWFQ